jgi:hypothetical protein
MPDTIESLRILLKEVEQIADTPHDSADLAELRHILVHRIAELEMGQAGSDQAATPSLKDDYELAS